MTFEDYLDAGIDLYEDINYGGIFKFANLPEPLNCMALIIPDARGDY